MTRLIRLSMPNSEKLAPSSNRRLLRGHLVWRREEGVEEDAWVLVELDAREALVDFFAHNSEGQALKPFPLAVDNVAPAKSRLKWYFHTPHTSLDSVREVMRLGGRIATDKMDAQLADLYALIRAVAGLPDDFPSDAEIPLPAQSDVYDQAARANFGELDEVLTGYLYYFDIAPGPRPRHGGVDGGPRQRGAQQAHRGLETAKGLQTFISCLFKPDGELDVTTYLGAEAYHPARADKTESKRGSLLRRGDNY
ncbi:hypothetical protein VSDG_07630 [Cytospora chrysosperma]|uniref:Uncharacterized protein n=1 Tax=Cytospora chrysosperma TaxID=252740 RepID=A0A423VLV7_CYTCH|nr:hypothetical protein VSDG_07630 [Valsa sordida]